MTLISRARALLRGCAAGTAKARGFIARAFVARLLSRIRPAALDRGCTGR